MLLTKKDYCISSALNAIDPNIIATVKYNDNGDSTVVYDDNANPNNAKPTEVEIDAAGAILLADAQSAANEAIARALKDRRIQLKLCMDAGNLLGEDMAEEQAELDALIA